MTSLTWNKQIGEELGRWHSQNINTLQKSPHLFQLLKKWANSIPNSFGDPKKDEKLQTLGTDRIKKEVYILD